MAPTFRDTICNSPQWKEWVKYCEDNISNPDVRVFDVHESAECDMLSPEHFQEFISFIVECL